MASRVLYSDGDFSLAIDGTKDIHTLPLTLTLPPDTSYMSEHPLDSSDTADATGTNATELADLPFCTVLLVEKVEQIELSSLVDDYIFLMMAYILSTSLFYVPYHM